MRLISLTADKDSFKPIIFRHSGLTLIVGKQKDPDKSDSGKTYNGVGKSLAIALIHYCLGAKANAELEEALPDWTFTLEFQIEKERYTSSRNTSLKKQILLNGEELSLENFRNKLGEAVFNLSEVKGLTFRALLPKFIRPLKQSYVSFDRTDSESTPYQNLLCNSFLLGLEIGLVVTKHDLTVRHNEIVTFKKRLKKDSVFKEFFTQNKNIEIELQDLDDQIQQIERDLERFQIADNYSQIKRDAEHTKRLLQEARNLEVVLGNAITNISRSLETQPDISEQKLFRLYEEAQAALPESVIKKINEVTDFHSKLLENRIKRLSGERTRLEKELESVRKDVATFSRQRDTQISFLGTHGALDDWVTISNHLSDLKSKAQKIRDYKALLQRYSDETQEIKIKLSNETKKTNKYLNQAKTLLAGNFQRFRSLARRFYPDKPGGLTISNNEGDNQIRFNIEAKIQDDASDGINEVKIFCYDMTLLKGRHNHNVNFVFHDSRLFSDIDHRQRATLFRLAHEQSHDSNTQYIATLNEEQITSIREQFDEDEFQKVILDNVVLELTDEAPSGKLLGIQVDMHYAG
jgi:uncharacterized protein YydD (DUF2326 family)